MSGLSDLYDFSPDQREAIARVESMRRMRDVRAEWRAHYRSMPAAGDRCVTPSPRNASAASSYFSLENAA